MAKAKRRVAVIGAGPAGAITIDALAREKACDLIRVFERREGPGGCWKGEEKPPPPISNLAGLAARTGDAPIEIPALLPAQTAKTQRPRFSESSVYPYLETNVHYLPMEFTQEPIPMEVSEVGRSLYGPDTPFRSWKVMLRYIDSLVDRNGYQDFVSYNTTVERAEKVGEEWKLTLRKEGAEWDYWWVEWFDAIVVASGHYSVPYIPKIEGLQDFADAYPGSVLHSKHFRGRDAFRDKRVVVVGASVSGADIAYDIVKTAQLPVFAVVEGHNFNGYFGGGAFEHPSIDKRSSISRINGRTVYLENGTWTLPFLPGVEVRNNRVPGLYQHVVYRKDPSLLFFGAVHAGLTFKIFEWQAVLAARRCPKFAPVFPDFAEYFNKVRELAGPGEEGLGGQLPPFDRGWYDTFMTGHELRKNMWKRLNAKAAEEIAKTQVAPTEASRKERLVEKSKTMRR
ncbi:hypothetical protein GGR57DRAFT_493947 [Xylariaceae sp. FL1272]|nr:hypothetical protein GGR57DRAFT_493947 [Xylariaceae sp. FL1272]